MPETIWLIVIVMLLLLTFLIKKLTPSMFILSALIALKMNKNKITFDKQVLIFILFGIIFMLVLEPTIKYLYGKFILYLDKKYNRNKKKVIKEEKKKNNNSVYNDNFFNSNKKNNV